MDKYYDILGVSKEATDEEIKKAFKKKAKEFHPDVNKSADAEEKFKEVNNAYQILSNDERRREHENKSKEHNDPDYSYGDICPYCKRETKLVYGGGQIALIIFLIGGSGPPGFIY